MANTVMMYEALGKGPDYPPRAITRRGIDKLLVIGEHEAYCQPCVSPVWDTALTCHALMEAGGEDDAREVKQGLDWLKPRQVLDLKGDWAVKAPDVRPGGWAFQYNNAHYPDLDDTAVVVMAMDRARRGSPAATNTIRRSRAAANGSRACRAATAAGPPSTSTISNTISTTSRSPTMARCSIRRPRTSPRAASRCWRSSARPPQTSKAMADGDRLSAPHPVPEGSWYGRWGLNYIYGTWSVLCALNAAGVDHQDPAIRKAVDWLVSIQNADGGWGEDAVSYRLDYKGFEGAPTTSSQTAWALLGLMAAGRGRKSGRRAGRGVPKSHTDRKRAVGRAALHGNGLSAGVLFALSWLLEILSALGAGAVSEFEKHQQQGGRGRDVNLGAGAAATAENSVDRNAIDPRPVLIVTGLVQEARIAAGPGMTVICSSSDPQQLRALLATLRSHDVRGVISFGVAGGLDPSLKSGDVVVATEVMAGDTRWLAGWR